MGYELIITEKPNAAKKIADALADGKAIREKHRGVTFYKVTHGDKDIVVGCAVGHLFGLVEDKKKKGWTYPVFNVRWEEISKTRKSAGYSKKYVTTLRKLAKDADTFTVATDYDIEGEVIGYNVLKHICKQKDGRRMKFSTLTKEDLRESYSSSSSSIDWGQANAGLTRHVLDWFYGINLSRALTTAIKKTGKFQLMSSGRVQGPALKIIVDREKEIAAFKPVPFWQIQLLCKSKGKPIEAWHEQDKFWEKEKADHVMERCKDKDAIIDDTERKQYKQAPPTPFDLTTLQMEAYRCLGIQPKETLEIAQELYTSGLISYPRTSSQQLPPNIGYKKILDAITKQDYYKELAQRLLEKKDLKPNNGKKTDPAHPAIYPTGNISNISGRKAKIYDLVVRRFLATFADPATRETLTLRIDVNNEIFLAKGTCTTEKGWHEFYGHHVKLKETEIPDVRKGDNLDVNELNLHDKETQPPKRYTPASIIKELEKRGLGTKATRAQIVDTLYNRHYVQDQSLVATELGMRTVQTLEKYSPLVLDEELTRHFEEEMEEIRQKQKDGDQVLEQAKEVLTKLLKEFKEHEESIGKELGDATQRTRRKMSLVGKCPNCSDGELMIRSGKFGSFIACNKYPDCKTTFSMPSNCLVKPAGETCESCGLPLIKIIKKRKRPQIICINKDCPKKEQEAEELKKLAKDKGLLNQKCPRCNEGELVLRKSVYGQFIGCSRYPKCRYTVSTENGN